jgi:tetratricopeptide (TPR) repeat protein
VLGVASAAAWYLTARYDEPSDPVASLWGALGGRRSVEGRLSGAGAFAPFVPGERLTRKRGGGGDSSRGRNAGVDLATAKLLAVTEQRPSETIGLASLLDFMRGETKQAIARLEDATAERPGTARLLNDLAVLYLARAESDDNARDRLHAVSIADEAVALDGAMPEARFNLALALEKVYLYPAAKRAWEEYLRLDGSSQWASEAREHLARLDEPPSSAVWDVERVRLVDAIERGDVATAQDIVSRYPDASRRYAIDALLPAWAEAVLG